MKNSPAIYCQRNYHTKNTSKIWVEGKYKYISVVKAIHSTLGLACVLYPLSNSAGHYCIYYYSLPLRQRPTS